MKVVRISRLLPCSAEAAWDAFRSPTHLEKICKPVVTFGKASAVPERWDQGSTATFNLRLFGFIPWSRHSILIHSVDQDRWTLTTKESGGAIRTWNHKFQITPLGPASCRCEDEIEIDAGPLTLIVWAYAQGLYRYRYSRWQKLLHSGSAHEV